MENPDIMLELDKLDVYEDCTFFIYDTINDSRCHFKFSTNGFPKEYNFDGHCTHVQRHGGKVNFINFKSNYVLSIDENEILSKLPI